MNDRHQIDKFRSGLTALKRGLAIGGGVAVAVAGWYSSSALALGGGTTAPAPAPAASGGLNASDINKGMGLK